MSHSLIPAYIHYADNHPSPARFVHVHCWKTIQCTTKALAVSQWEPKRAQYVIMYKKHSIYAAKINSLTTNPTIPEHTELPQSQLLLCTYLLPIVALALLYVQCLAVACCRCLHMGLVPTAEHTYCVTACKAHSGFK